MHRARSQSSAMRRGYALALAMLTAALAQPVDRAQAEDCPPPSPPQILVDTRVMPLKTDHSQSVAQLSGMPINSVIAHRSDHRKTGGITAGRIGFNTLIRFDGAGPCRRVGAVNVDMILDQTVLMASDYVLGSCEYDAIWEHELLHVAVDRKMIERAKPELAAAVADASAELEPASARDGDFDEYARRWIESAVDRFGRDLRRQRMRLQNGVDRPSEYRAVRKRCDGWR